MKQSVLFFSFMVISIALALASCTKKPLSAASELTAEQLVERGKAIYLGNCIACHNSDPQKEGSVGPAVAGSSAQLLETKILKAEYPKDYRPKRATRTMPAMAHLKEEIPALRAYLSFHDFKGASNP